MTILDWKVFFYDDNVDANNAIECEYDNEIHESYRDCNMMNFVPRIGEQVEIVDLEKMNNTTKFYIVKNVYYDIARKLVHVSVSDTGKRGMTFTSYLGKDAIE